MENIWLLEPVLEALENIAACRNKVSKSELILLFRLPTLEYTRLCGPFLAADSYNNAKDTMNNYKINEENPPP